MENKSAIPAEERFAYLEGRLDSMQAAGYKTRTILDPSVLIAIAALILSLSTTFYSIVKERRQNVESITNQLRSTINQFGELNFKVVDATNKYKGDNDAIAALHGWIATQNNVLTAQVLHLAEILGDSAEGADLMIVANRLRTIGREKEAESLLARAILLPTSNTDKISIFLEHGSLQYQQKKNSEGAKSFMNAITLVESIPGYQSDQYMRWQMAFLYASWATAVSSTDCKQSGVYLTKAVDWSSTNTTPDWFKQQLLSGRKWLDDNCK